ncbi:hypothetical protein Glove_166g209 [Diversispora epigaea]|uniref:Uncharacterized protein n=1 Tax=Diversispora epigaea TaxID=1348612 RepID=A0A397ITG2_9GLOM|nr:hypothetical protein Glove_166g209 [Diversispora epigaea]
MSFIEEFKQYENMIFPNLDALQKAIKDILEAFRYLKELHIKVPDDSDNIRQLAELNRKFNTLVDMRAKESLKMSMDLEDFIEYFRMLTADNVTVDTLLQILLGLKDVVKIRINSSEELKNEFEKIRISMLSYIASQPSGFDDDGEEDDDDDKVANHAIEKQSSKIIIGIQPPNFRSILYQILLEASETMGISTFIYFLLRWVEPVKMWQFSIDKLKKILPNKFFSLFGGNYLKAGQSSNSSIENLDVSQSSLSIANLLQNNAPFWLAFVVFSGCCFVNREIIYRHYRDIKDLITTFNRKNDTTITDNEKKYKRNISTKLPVISTHLEILIQFWKQQFDIFESHINALGSIDGNIIIRLPNRSMDGIIARCTEEKINCNECFLILNKLI